MRSELRALRERIRQVEAGGHRDTPLRREYNHKLRAQLQGGGSIYIMDPRNIDVNDTINRTLLGTIREGEVTDTPENRTNAALVCITSLYRQLQKLKGEVSTLKDELGLKLQKSEAEVSHTEKG